MLRWLTALVLLLPIAAAAQSFPERPVRLVVPYPAGGSNDILARLLAVPLGERWGQQVVVENRAGANGNIGAETVAKAAPDGHTMLLAAAPPLAINQSLYAKLAYDPGKDLAAVALVASVPIALMVHPAVPAQTPQELLALARAKPGTLNFGSSGNGSTNHLAGELLKSMAKLDIVHVPYRGAAPAMNDLVAGQIPIMFDNMPAVIQQVRAGTVRAIAVASKTRSKLLPDAPTLDEAGVKGFEASSWFGLAAPAGTPATLVAKINDDVRQALKQPALAAKFAELGADPGDQNPAEFAAFLAAEREKWGHVIKESGARVD